MCLKQKLKNECWHWDACSVTKFLPLHSILSLKAVFFHVASFPKIRKKILNILQETYNLYVARETATLFSIYKQFHKFFHKFQCWVCNIRVFSYEKQLYQHTSIDFQVIKWCKIPTFIRCIRNRKSIKVLSW